MIAPAPDQTRYQSGLLHLIRVLKKEAFDPWPEHPPVEKLVKAENIDPALAQNVAAALAQNSPVEIFRQGIELIMSCSEEYKIRTFITLLKWAEADKRISKREIQFLQYACRLTARQQLEVRLQVDEQTIKPEHPHAVIHLVSGHEIDVYILERLLRGYLVDIDIEIHASLTTFIKELDDGKRTPGLVIVNIDPLRWNEKQVLDQWLNRVDAVSVYILTFCYGLLMRNCGTFTHSAIKGIFENPLTEKQIRQIAGENNLKLV